MIPLCLAMLAGTMPLAMPVLDTSGIEPGRLPAGWRMKVNHGTPDVTVIDDPRGRVLRLKSRANSFGIERDLDVDSQRFPYLVWQWKVSELPRGGDVRHYSTDDQAAQLLIAFDERHMLSYIWDSTAPKGDLESESPFPLVHVFALVCRSGAGDLNQWVSETRNVAEDYERAFGHKLSSHVKGIRLQINSQHTGTSAEGYFGDIAFRATP
jgi:hypothetical protein